MLVKVLILGLARLREWGAGEAGEAEEAGEAGEDEENEEDKANNQCPISNAQCPII